MIRGNTIQTNVVHKSHRQLQLNFNMPLQRASTAQNNVSIHKQKLKTQELISKISNTKIQQEAKRLPSNKRDIPSEPHIREL